MSVPSHPAPRAAAAAAAAVAPPVATPVGADPRPELRLVEEPSRSHAALYLVGYAVVIVLTILGAVGLNALAAGDAVRARDLDDRVADAERRYTHLIAQVAQLETPERIRSAAEGLGMVPAEDPTYLHVDALPGEVPPTPAPPVLGPDGEAGQDPLKPVLSVQR